MTTEFILLLGLFAFLLLGAFMGDNGPKAVFERSGARLGARLESQISTGKNFMTSDGAANRWEAPTVAAPTEALK